MLKKGELYRCADYPVEVTRQLAPTVQTGGAYSLHGRVRARWTGEKRAPKKGEWYLSGAVIEAYRAPNDLTTAYHIAELVDTKHVQPSRQVVKVLHTRECGQSLFDSDGFRATCTQPYGTEHDHSDKTAREAVAQGVARAKAEADANAT